MTRTKTSSKNPAPGLVDASTPIRSAAQPRDHRTESSLWDALTRYAVLLRARMTPAEAFSRAVEGPAGDRGSLTLRGRGTLPEALAAAHLGTDAQLAALRTLLAGAPLRPAVLEAYAAAGARVEAHRNARARLIKTWAAVAALTGLAAAAAGFGSIVGALVAVLAGAGVLSVPAVLRPHLDRHVSADLNWSRMLLVSELVAQRVALADAVRLADDVFNQLGAPQMPALDERTLAPLVASAGAGGVAAWAHLRSEAHPTGSLTAVLAVAGAAAASWCVLGCVVAAQLR